MNLDRRVGPFTLRAWGLAVNLLGNVLMLHGAVRSFTAQASTAELYVGLAVTGLCIAVLSIPDK